MSTAPSHPQVERYIRKLRSHLGHLSEADRDEIAREIEGHVIERWEADSKGALDAASLAGVFGKVGTPEFIAAQYCEQRGWAPPPKRHRLRNGLLIGLGIVILLIAGFSYMATRFILGPIAGFLGGKGSVIEINENGIKILDGKISIGEDGIRIGGVLEIGGDDGERALAGDGIPDGIFLDRLLEMKSVAEEEGTDVIAAAGLDHVTVDVKNALVVIQGGDADEARLTFVEKAYGRDADAARRALAQTEIRRSLVGSELKVETVYPDRLPAGVRTMSVEIRMTVPKRAGASVEMKNGKIDVADLGGSVTFDAKNGKATVADIGGNLGVDFKNGTVTARGIGGSATLEMKNGHVTLSNVRGDATVEMLNGPLAIEGVGGNLNLESKNAPVTVGGVAGDITVDAKTGPVTLSLVPNYEFTLKGEASIGKISCNFPVHQDGDEVTATVGKGTHAVNVSTKIGSVTITKGM